MYSLKAAAAIVGVIVFSSACSSGLEENAKPLEASADFEKVFGAYDVDGDENVTAKELVTREKEAHSTAITDETVQSVLDTYDMNADGLLDKVEFTGLLKAKILLGLPNIPGWKA